MDPTIQVNELSRSYRSYQKQPGLVGAFQGLWRRQYQLVPAVDRISFEIQQGELVGFLGPNGAGKTTTLKMLAGLLYPTSGSARVLGYTPWERKDGYRRQFALLLGQKNQLWWDLPARESLELNAEIYGIDRTRYQRAVGELTEMLAVTDKLGVMVRELSLGERMKMELIAALLHEPRVLFLDEPTIGLDVLSQKTVRDFLRDYNRRRQTTILLTSHYMADIEALCRRVILIDHGQISFDGALETILDRFADSKIITVQCEGTVPQMQRVLREAGELLEHEGGLVRLKVPRDRVIPVCKMLLDTLPVTDIDIEEVPIEDVIGKAFRPRT